MLKGLKDRPISTADGSATAGSSSVGTRPGGSRQSQRGEGEGGEISGPGEGWVDIGGGAFRHEVTGDEYAGGWGAGGVFHGDGQLRSSKGIVYSGQFKDGHKHGQVGHHI